jgi:Fic family protein
MLQGHHHSARKPAGQWRRGPVYVTDARDAGIAAYTAPDADMVPALMQELIDWLNVTDDAHPLVRAAMAHLRLVSIRPWTDGNGRMSRSLQTLMIAREGVLAPEFSSIEAWLGRPGNTWEYYRELTGRGAHFLPDRTSRTGSPSISRPTTSRPRPCAADSTGTATCGTSSSPSPTRTGWTNVR